MYESVFLVEKPRRFWMDIGEQSYFCELWMINQFYAAKWTYLLQILLLAFLYENVVAAR